MSGSVSSSAVLAAVSVGARLGVVSTEPAVLADGANVIVHLRPAPVVAKVAASTPDVRPDVAAWLQRELDVSVFLEQTNIPVMAPACDIPAEVHHGGGRAMSFWTYLGEPSAALRPDEDTIGSLLRDLHAALREYPRPLPVMTSLGDIPAFLRRQQTRLDSADIGLLDETYQRLTGELARAASGTGTRGGAAADTGAGAGQVLHGDAGAGNLMAVGPGGLVGPGWSVGTGGAAGTGGSAATESTRGTRGTGWLWHDFEDACTGPVEWDLAATTASPRFDRSRILAAYEETVDDELLRVCERLRRLHLTIWYSLYAERLPACRARAAELVNSWRKA